MTNLNKYQQEINPNQIKPKKFSIVSFVLPVFLAVSVGLTGCETRKDIYSEGYQDGQQVGYAKGYQDGEKTAQKEAYQEGLAEGKKIGKQQGFDEGKKIGKQQGLAEGKKIGKQQGLAEGKKIGYENGYQVGYDEGYQDGYQTAMIDILKLYGSLGILLGLSISISSILIVTRRLWIEELISQLRQIHVMLIVGKSKTRLEPELYQQIVSLSKHIDKVKKLLAQDSQLSAEKSKLENLNRQIINLASLLQEKRNALSEMETTGEMEKSINEDKQLLPQASDAVKSELEKAIAEKSNKLTNIHNIQDKIKCYELKLHNYPHLLDNLKSAIDNWQSNKVENEINESETEKGLSFITEITEALAQLEQQSKLEDV